VTLADRAAGLHATPEVIDNKPVRLLDSSGGGCGLTSGLSGQLLPRSLASGGFAGCLLGAGHDCFGSQQVNMLSAEKALTYRKLLHAHILP